MAKPPLILVIAGDPGAANALAPVCLALQQRGDFRIRGLAYKQARTLWAKRGIAFDELDETISKEWIQHLLVTSKPALVLTGTSANGLDFEKVFVAVARLEQVPSLALLDHWMNYRIRFADENGTLAFLPDRIAIMDEQARAEMIAEGFPPEQLVVTGHPAFDELTPFRLSTTAETSAAVRAEFGVRPDELLLVFVSEPVEYFNGTSPSNPYYLGYTEHTILPPLVSALESIARRSSRKVALLIRPHPLQKSAEFNRYRGTYFRVLVSDRADGRAVVLASQVVIGMTSMLLMEACLLRCTVLSLQPNLCAADTLPSNRRGWSAAVYKEEDIEPVVERYLFDKDARDQLQHRLSTITRGTNASQHLIHLIDEMVASYKCVKGTMHDE
jgi:hypothetical protein